MATLFDQAVNSFNEKYNTKSLKLIDDYNITVAYLIDKNNITPGEMEEFMGQYSGSVPPPTTWKRVASIKLKENGLTNTTKKSLNCVLVCELKTSPELEVFFTTNPTKFSRCDEFSNIATVGKFESVVFPRIGPDMEVAQKTNSEKIDNLYSRVNELTRYILELQEKTNVRAR